MICDDNKIAYYVQCTRLRNCKLMCPHLNLPTGAGTRSSWWRESARVQWPSAGSCPSNACNIITMCLVSFCAACESCHQDSSHPAHDLFEPLPSSRRFRSIKTRTNCFSTSFFPLAVQTLPKQKRFFSHPQQTHIPLSN